MPNISVLKTLLRELITQEQSPRINEPDLIMDDPEKVEAYTRAGRKDGEMAPIYLFHCAQICEIIKPGDTVVDLGCGPATQLEIVARLNPKTNFIGVDLSSSMLEKAQNHINEQGLKNVKFRKGNIADLSFFDNQSIDAVISTVALHHLPNEVALEKAFSEVGRILKKNGGLYIVDFGHLKSEKSITDFAYQYADSQPELFTLDYLYSLRAAFLLKDFKRLTSKYLKEADLYSTFLTPFMVAIKSRSRSEQNHQEIIKQLHDFHENLPNPHKEKLSDLRTVFRLGGLHSKLLNR